MGVRKMLRPKSTWSKYKAKIKEREAHGEKFYSIRNSSQYLSQEEQDRIRYKEGKEKWISKQGFRGYTVSSSVLRETSIGPCVANSGEYLPPNNYQFRKFDRNYIGRKKGKKVGWV